MFIRVDLPAPFSPSRACTSPRASSKSTPSFATTPGNRFVIALSSRRGGSAMGMARGGPRPAPHWSSRNRVRDLDLAALDLVFLGLHLVDDALRDLRAHLAEPDAVVRERERRRARMELALLGLLDGLE